MIPPDPDCLMVLPEDSGAGGMIIRGNFITAGLGPTIFKNQPISFSVRRANIANRKRYRFGKPRNHSGFGVFSYLFSKLNLKDIISQNDLWGELELNLEAILKALN